MIADLLEARQRRQHRSPAQRALLFVPQGRHQIVDDRAVQRGLLDGEIGAHGDLGLLRKVGDDRRVGLLAPKDERAGQRGEAGERVGITVAFDRLGEATTEGRRDPSRPGLTRSITARRSSSRFSTGVPVRAIR